VKTPTGRITGRARRGRGVASDALRRSRNPELMGCGLKPVPRERRARAARAAGGRPRQPRGRPEGRRRGAADPALKQADASLIAASCCGGSTGLYLFLSAVRDDAGTWTRRRSLFTCGRPAASGIELVIKQLRA
jgi:hypothetical protein